jgi:hypothetical protein
MQEIGGILGIRPSQELISIVHTVTIGVFG